MNHKFTAIFMACALAFSLLPLSVGADPLPLPHSHCVCGASGDIGGYTHDTATVWSTWNGVDDLELSNDESAETLYLYLGSDAVRTGTLIVPGGKTLYLCLNGYSLTMSGEDSAICVESGATFSLCNCTGNGKISGGTAPLGGGIDNEGTLHIYGGTLTGNHAEYGGAVYNNGTFIMQGGSITTNDANVAGGGVWNGENAILKLSGGSITQNRSASGGGIYASQGGVVELQGDIVISSNMNEARTARSNLYLPHGSGLSITGALTHTGHPVGVSMETPGAFAGLPSGNLSSAYCSLFSDDETYSVSRDDRQIKLSIPIYCGEIDVAGSETSYWKNDGSGGITSEGAGPDDYNILFTPGNTQSTSCLTLNDAILTQPHSYDDEQSAALMSCQPLELKLMGSNTLACNVTNNSTNSGIYFSDHLTISGMGTVDITAANAGESMAIRSVVSESPCQLTMKQTGAVRLSSSGEGGSGILIFGDVSFEDGTTKISGGSSSVMATGEIIYAEHMVAKGLSEGGAYHEETALFPLDGETGAMIFCGETPATEVQIASTVPKIISGGNTIRDEGDTGSLTVTSSADNADFVRVEVGQGNYTTLTEGIDYTRTSGSTIITLTPEYLATLSPGSYTLHIVSTTGTAAAAFTIRALPEPPQPGTSSGDGYTITTVVGPGGSLSPNGSIYVREGGEKAFTVSPDPGYEIDRILIDGDEIESQESFTLSGIRRDHTVEVTFRKVSNRNPETGLGGACESLWRELCGLQ